MSTTQWHLDHQLAAGYARDALSDVLAASVEQHLMNCATCRALLQAQIDQPRLDRLWAEVIERVETPRKNALERLLNHVGLDEGTSRLVAATPSLRGAWLNGVLICLALALATAYSGPHGVALFLALAPVLPVVGVALAFGPQSDPTYEIAAAAPYSSLRLLAVRAGFVVVSTFAPTIVAGWLLPGDPWLAVAWLLPALALTVGTVTLSTRVAPHVAGIGLSAAWVVVVLPGLAHGRTPLLAAELPTQLISAVVIACCAGVLFVQRHDLSEMLRRSA